MPDSKRVEPTAVRFVLANCAEPGRDAELNEWYDAYAADCTRPGLLVNARRYANLAAAGTDDDPRYVAVYDIVISDPERAWPETKDHPSRLFHSPSALLAVGLRATYRRIEPIVPVGDAPQPQSVVLVLGDDERTAESDATRVTRYELVEGQPDPPRYLEIHESDRPQGPVVSLVPRAGARAASLLGPYALTFAHP